MNKALSLALMFSFACLLSPIADAQRPTRPARTRPAPKKAEVKKDDEKKEEDKYFHLKNVDVYPISEGPLRSAEILVKNGKIHKIGRELEVPKDAKVEVLDGQGMRAYPGMISLNGNGILSRRGKPEDNYDPYSPVTEVLWAHGITSFMASSVAMKLVADLDDLSDLTIRSGLFTGLQYSSRNPRAKKTTWDDFKKAQSFLREYGKNRSSKEAKAAAAKLGSASRYLPLLEGQTRAVFNVRTAHAITEVCELIEAFGFKAIIRGCTEGWTIPGVVGRAGVTAIISPRERSDPDETINRKNGYNGANSSILYNHGVTVVFATQSSTIDFDGQPGVDALAVPFEAASAVRGGLPEEAAIKGITLNAARCYGIDDRVGSLEVGKDADIIVCDGELLHYATMVQWTIVNGKLAYDKEKSRMFKHIRSRDKTFKKDSQWWPRPFAPMPEEWEYDAQAAAKAELSKAAAKAKKDDGKKDAKKPGKKAAKKDAKKADSKPASKPVKKDTPKPVSPPKKKAGV